MENPKKTKWRRRGGVRVSTNKIVDRITFEPRKHKQKFIRGLRQKLANRTERSKTDSVCPQPIMTVGSININGLDIEANYAAEALTQKYNLDVRRILIKKINLFSICS